MSAPGAADSSVSGRSRFQTARGDWIPLSGWLSIPRVLFERFGRFSWTRPWFNPGAVAYLTQVLKGRRTLLEVGAGRSTLWYARKGLEVTSLETDPKWFEFLHRELDGYHSVSLNLVDEHEVLKWLADLAPKHDVCVLDALSPNPRVSALELLTGNVVEDGVIVHDDSDWLEHRGGDKVLEGWYVKRIAGMKARPFRAYETSFYSRNPLP